MKPATHENTADRVELARQLFREFYVPCFWHAKPDLVITEAMIPWVAQELRKHGGRRGLLAAEDLGRCR